MMRRPPRSTLFPYPTLFRSEVREAVARQPVVGEGGPDRPSGPPGLERAQPLLERFLEGAARARGRAARMGDRSEEHTSELQSRPHLVCRLLLEKKKNIPRPRLMSSIIKSPQVIYRI